MQTAKVTGINLIDVLRDHFAQIEHLLDNEKPFDVLSVLPVKNTPIPGRLAKSIGYENFDSLKRAVFKKLDDGGSTADGLKAALRSKLPTLPSS